MDGQHSSALRAPAALVRTTALLCGLIAASGAVVVVTAAPKPDDDLPFRVVSEAGEAGSDAGPSETASAPLGFVRVDGGGEGFSISVPATWELDDASFYGALAESVAGSQDIVLVASDPGTAGATHASLARLPDVTSLEAAGFAQSVRAALEANGAVGVTVEQVALPAGAAVRSHSSLPIAPPAPESLDCTQYYIAAPDGVWMLSLFSDAPSIDAAELDQIAASLLFSSSAALPGSVD